MRRAGARIELLKAGELAAAIAASLPETGIDVMMGIGDAKQGIIAAAAVGCLNAGLQVQFMPSLDAEPESLPDEFRKIYRARDLVGGDVMFAATGVSRSDFSMESCSSRGAR